MGYEEWQQVSQQNKKQSGLLSIYVKKLHHIWIIVFTVEASKSTQ